MEELKQRLNKNKELFKKSIENELKIFIDYFKEVIELKNEFFDYDIELVNKNIGFKKGKELSGKKGVFKIKITVDESDLNLFFSLRSWGSGYRITKKGIKMYHENGCYGWGSLYRTASDHINKKTEIRNPLLWNVFYYLKDEIDIKSILEQYITEKTEKDINKIEKYLNKPILSNNKCQCGLKLPKYAKFCSGCGKEINKNYFISIDPAGDTKSVVIWDKDMNIISEGKKQTQNLNDGHPDLVIIDDINEYMNLKNIKCQYCNAQLQDERELKRHMIAQHPKKEKTWFEIWKKKYPKTTEKWNKEYENKNCMKCIFYETDKCRYPTFTNNGDMEYCGIYSPQEYPNYQKYCKIYAGKRKYYPDLNNWKYYNREDENCMLCQFYKTYYCTSPDNYEKGGLLKPCNKYKKKEDYYWFNEWKKKYLLSINYNKDNWKEIGLENKNCFLCKSYGKKCSAHSYNNSCVGPCTIKYLDYKKEKEIN